ncbi:MAG: hypothetical protein M3419_11295 [Actinomycetota bacterium]|nr:hypothetical protein [Actinomycetota bacterium]
MTSASHSTEAPRRAADQHGSDGREAQAAANRPLFLGALGDDYLPSVPEIDAAPRGGGRVADIGCGLGWSSIVTDSTEHDGYALIAAFECIHDLPDPVGVLATMRALADLEVLGIEGDLSGFYRLLRA